jgi:putative toxin-antitoxin system antitoxin component (TIGR02293 family)
VRRSKYSSKSAAVLFPKAKHFAPAEAVERVKQGLPFAELETLRSEIDESLDSLARQLSISRSTLQRRRAERRLLPQESDRVMRFWRLLQHATKIFGDAARARQWLKFPQRGLGGAVPLDYASTEVGAREVENLLGRIDYGVYS